MAIVNVLAQNLPKMLSMGGRLLGSLISGIGSKIGNLGSVIGKVATKIIDGVKGIPGKMVKWGKDMIQGLIDGIKGMIGKIGDAVKGVANKIKSFLHFSRPDEGPLAEYEEWMPDMVHGLSDSLKKASPDLINQTKALASGMSDALNVDTNINGTVAGGNYASNTTNLIEAFKQALSEMKIELDDEEMGKFVDRTVTKAIYQ